MGQKLICIAATPLVANWLYNLFIKDKIPCYLCQYKAFHNKVGFADTNCKERCQREQPHKYARTPNCVSSKDFCCYS